MNTLNQTSFGEKYGRYLRSAVVLIVVLASVACASVADSRSYKQNSPATVKQQQATKSTVPGASSGVPIVLGMALLGMIVVARKQQQDGFGPTD